MNQTLEGQLERLTERTNQLTKEIASLKEQMLAIPSTDAKYNELRLAAWEFVNFSSRFESDNRYQARLKMLLGDYSPSLREKLKETPKEHHSSQRRDWTAFETDLVQADLDEIVKQRSLQFGRSTNSLVWKLWRELDKRRE